VKLKPTKKKSRLNRIQTYDLWSVMSFKDLHNFAKASLIAFRKKPKENTDGDAVVLKNKDTELTRADDVMMAQAKRT